MVATDSAAIETSAPEVAAVPTGDPSILGLSSFVVGAVALSLATVGYVPPAAVGAALPIILGATGLGLLITTVWCAYLGQSFVACVFGVFTGFWFSYAALVLGLQHNWFQIPAADVTHSVALFLISWAVVMFFLTVGSIRLPGDLHDPDRAGLRRARPAHLRHPEREHDAEQAGGLCRVRGFGPRFLPVPQLVLGRAGRRALPARPAAAAIGLVEAVARSRVRADLPQRPKVE
jgi:hypothetical protein